MRSYRHYKLAAPRPSRKVATVNPRSFVPRRHETLASASHGIEFSGSIATKVLWLELFHARWSAFALRSPNAAIKRSFIGGIT